MQIVENKKARHDYFIDNKFEAGLVLFGLEIKSIRERKVNIEEAYVKVINGEVFIVNMNISKFDKASNIDYNPTRSRKLLLTKQEIKKLIIDTERKGKTIVPLRLYLKRGKAKIEIATAKGKKKFDKREIEKKKEVDKKIRKTLKEVNS